MAYEVANDANCSAPASGSVAVIAILGTPEGKNLSFACTAESAAATSVPPAASQGGTSATLTTGTDRFLSASWSGNVLWVAGNTGCTPGGDSHVRSCLNVEFISATSTGTVGAVTAYPVQGVNGAALFDPAVGLDSSGNAILTFDESSSTAFELMMTAAITGGVWSSYATLQLSKTLYSPGGCSSCTWGDYTAAVQDPSHPHGRVGGLGMDQRRHGDELREREHLLGHVHRSIHLCRAGDLGADPRGGTGFRR